MLLNKFYFVGLNILLLAYTVQSIVILTANADDIRRLARKFVNEPLANKIADLVIKTTEYISSDMSPDLDNTKQEKNPVETRNIGRSKHDVPFKRLTSWEKGENSLTDSAEENNYKSKAKRPYIKRPAVSTHEEHKTANRPMNIEFQVNNKIRNKESAKEKLKQMKFDSEVMRPAHKKRKQTFKLSANYEENDGRDFMRYATTEKSALRGFNIENKLTTKKQKVEFDQYDNPNYRKRTKERIAATSGPVQLLKRKDEKPWWEGDTLSDNEKNSW